MDLTFSQYWFTTGIESFPNYKLTKTSGDAKETRFGSEYFGYQRAITELYGKKISI
jgi:hypothetical protein